MYRDSRDSCTLDAMNKRSSVTVQRPHVLVDVAGRTDLLTVTQFAHRVGVTASEVKEMHLKGYFLAAIEGGKGRGKMRLYAPEQVEMYREMKKVKVQEGEIPGTAVAFSGLQAQAGFMSLREGKRLEDIVLEHGFHPDVVVGISRAWARLKNSVFLSAETLDAIAQLPIDGPIPITKEKDVYEVLKLAAESSTCLTCRKGQRTTCRKCVGQIASQACIQVRQEERERAASTASAPAPLLQEQG